MGPRAYADLKRLALSGDERAINMLPFYKVWRPLPKAGSMHIYIFDIDGTISDGRHRNHLAEARKYDEFHALCHEDKPYENVCRVLRALARDHCVILCSGRNEANRRATELWCARHDLRVDEILLRPNNDFTPAEQLKLTMLTDYFGSMEKALAEVTAIFDDSEKNVEAFRNLGFTVFALPSAQMG